MGSHTKVNIQKITERLRIYSSSEPRMRGESRSPSTSSGWGSRQARIIRLTSFIVIVLAFFLRFYQLGKVPPSLNWDETALGYNAYSILKTGRDEYGVRFPTILRSFGDYKPPLYTYLTIPSVAVFGLNEFAVRFPSALFGFLTVLLTYFLVRELFLNNNPTSKNQKIKNSLSKISHFPHLTSLLFAISPWHIQFSRGAFEANLGLFLAVLGTYLFLKALKNRHFLLLSAVIFSLSMYAYHSSRIFVPLLVLLLAFVYRKELFISRKAKRVDTSTLETVPINHSLKASVQSETKNRLALRGGFFIFKKWTAISFLIGMIFIFPFIKSLTQGEILTRFSGVSAFNDPAILNRSIEKIEDDNNSFIGRMVHNRRIEYAKIFLKNYFSHFDANFLFIEADQNPRHHAPANGLLYFWEIITIPIGFFTLLKLKGRGKWVIFSFLFLAPIAAAPAQASPHAIRFLNSLPAWIVISSFGLAFLFKRAKQFWSLIIILILINFVYWGNLYFTHLPIETSQYWQYGYKEMVNEVSKIEKNYDKVMITGQYDQPYIFFLFYKKYDPQKYQAEYKNSEKSSKYERAFNKYQFLEKIDLAEIEKDKQILIVATHEEVGGKDDFKIIKKINFLDGLPAFLIGEKI
ncbi:glycosyltransferase family 39 protein, partial [Candidatus Microgenomates bacterium]|nr:glycosyltransferase family 39 protein [Candidatus Microgenomates bacterium]